MDEDIVYSAWQYAAVHKRTGIALTSYFEYNDLL
jgi:hypothetical protein